MPLGMGDLSSC